MLGRIIDGARALVRKGGAYVFFGQFLSKFISFFGSIVLIRILSKQDFGVLSYYENIYGYAFVLAGAGLGNAIVRFVVLGKTPDEKYSVFKYAMITAFLVDCVLAVVLVGISFIFPHDEQYAPYSTMLCVMAAVLPFQDAYLNCTLNERAQLENRYYAVFTFSVTTAFIASRVIGAYVGGLIGVIVAQLAVYSVAGIGGIVVEKRRHYCDAISMVLERAKRKEINSYAIQYMVTNGLWAIFMLNDVFLLGHFGIAPVELAEYKVAYVFPGNLAIISTAIGIVVGPYFILHEDDRDWVQSNFSKLFFGSALLIGACSFLLGLFAEPIIVILYGEQYANAAGMMRLLLIVCFLNSGVRYTFANVLAAMGKIKYNMRIAVAGVLVQVALGVAFIPQLGVFGVIIANGVAQVMMCFLLGVVFYRLYYRR